MTTYYHEQYVNNENTAYILYDVYYEGQTFTPLLNNTVVGVDFKLYKTGSGCGNVTLKLYAVDGSGHPTGSVLATSSAVDSSAFTTDTDGEWITFTFTSSYTCVAGTEYALVLEPAGGDPSNTVRVIADQADCTYEQGARLFSSDSGSSWSYLTGADMLFRTIVEQDYTLLDFYQGTATPYIALILNSANDWAGQSWTLGSTAYAPTHAAIWCKKGPGDNVGTLDFEVYAVDGSGHPAGSALCSGTVPDSDVSESYSWVLCTFSTSTTLSANTKYCLVVHGDDLDASNILIWSYDDSLGSSAYAGGDQEWSTDGGSSWSTDTTQDQLFRIYADIGAIEGGYWRIILTEYMPSVTPHLADIKLDNATASRLLSTDASKVTESVTDLTNWIAGTANEINVADDGDGTITIGIVDPLVVAKGGTGAATLTDHSLLVGSGTDAVTALGAATNGQLPIGSTGADPVLAGITGTANHITVTNGAGSITLDVDDGIANNKVVVIDSADVADNEYARFTANGLESLTAAEVLTDLAPVYSDISGNDAGTDVTAAELEELTDGSETSLHSHVDEDEKVKVDAAATAGYIGAASNDGVLRTGTGLGYADGGNFVTLSLSHLGIESLTDPNDDQLMGWDDTDGATKFIDIGSGLSYDHATHTLSASGTDSDAIHDNVAGEISAITEKASPVDADLVIIEDSADSNNKKKAQLGNLPGGGGSTFTSRFHVYLSADQSIPSGSFTKIQLNTEVFDGDNEFDNATNYRFTAGSAGYYVICAGAEVKNLGAGKFAQLAVKVDGTTYEIAPRHYVTSAAQDYVPLYGSKIIYLAASSYVELQVYHNHGSNRNVAGARHITYLSGHRVS